MLPRLLRSKLHKTYQQKKVVPREECDFIVSVSNGNNFEIQIIICNFAISNKLSFNYETYYNDSLLIARCSLRR